MAHVAIVRHTILAPVVRVIALFGKDREIRTLQIFQILIHTHAHEHIVFAQTHAVLEDSSLVHAFGGGLVSDLPCQQQAIQHLLNLLRPVHESRLDIGRQRPHHGIHVCHRDNRIPTLDHNLIPVIGKRLSLQHAAEKSKGQERPGCHSN